MKDRLLRHADMIKSKRRSVHDRTVDSLVNRLRHTHDHTHDSMYDVIAREIEFFRPYEEYQTAGEIDSYACRYRKGDNKYLLLFEVKSFNNQRNKAKAHMQLDREEAILAQANERVFKFYVTPRRIEWYRSKS